MDNTKDKTLPFSFCTEDYKNNTTKRRYYIFPMFCYTEITKNNN